MAGSAPFRPARTGGSGSPGRAAKRTGRTPRKGGRRSVNPKTIEGGSGGRNRPAEAIPNDDRGPSRTGRTARCGVPRRPAPIETRADEPTAGSDVGRIPITAALVDWCRSRADRDRIDPRGNSPGGVAPRRIDQKTSAGRKPRGADPIEKTRTRLGRRGGGRAPTDARSNGSSPGREAVEGRTDGRNRAAPGRDSPRCRDHRRTAERERGRRRNRAAERRHTPSVLGRGRAGRPARTRNHQPRRQAARPREGRLPDSSDDAGDGDGVPGISKGARPSARGAAGDRRTARQRRSRKESRKSP